MSTTGLVFLLGFGTALLLALVRHPIWGLYAYVATFYLHPPDRWWGADLPNMRWALLAAAVTLVATLLNDRPKDAPERTPWQAQPAARLLLILTGWMWLQNAWALGREDHLEASILFTKYVVLFYLMYRLLDTRENIRGFLLAHVLGCLYLGYLAWAAPPGGRLEGVGGPGIDEANALGMHLGTGALAAGALVVSGPLWIRAAALASVPLIINGIIQTQSRGAFLGLAVGGLAALWLSPKVYRKYWYVFGVLGVAMLLRMAPDTFWERMSTIRQPGEISAEDESIDKSSRTRIVLLEAQWQMFLDYPLGTGHRGTAWLSPRYLDSQYLTRSRSTPDDSPGARSSHNTAMTALVEQGIPGIILYSALLWWVFRVSQRIKSESRARDDMVVGLFGMVAGATVVTVTVAGMFADYFKAEVTIWSLALLAALTELLRHGAPAAETAAKETRPPQPGHGSTAGGRPGTAGAVTSRRTGMVQSS